MKKVVKEEAEEVEVAENTEVEEEKDKSSSAETTILREATDGTADDKKPAKKTKTDENSMKSLMEELGDDILPFVEGDMVEAKVLAVGGNRIWVDVMGQSLGFIPEKEITTKSGLSKGDSVFASVISMDNEEGNVVLSMKRADREKYWLEMQQKFDSGEPISVQIVDANKGGLMTDIGGIQGFLPVSQLSPANYPRVSGGDKDEILNRLRQLIGTELMVKVINCDKENNKLIFSEKAVRAEEVKTKIDKYKVGDKITGKVTGVVDFGLFVSLDPQIEGLVHISEISWSRVSDLSKLYKVGDEIHVMIIGVDEGKISLSVKRLLKDPWVEAASRFKVGSDVTGTVTKITPFGAFVSLGSDIDGLVHVSELSAEHVVDPGEIVDLGKEYKFKVISIEPESHRLGLSLKEVKAEKVEQKEEKELPNKPKVEKPAKETKVEKPAKKVKAVKKAKTE